MTYPALPDVTDIADHFTRALREARREGWPYRHWKLGNVLPEAMCTGS